jgi:hypothetical protein
MRSAVQESHTTRKTLQIYLRNTITNDDNMSFFLACVEATNAGVDLGSVLTSCEYCPHTDAILATSSMLQFAVRAGESSKHIVSYLCTSLPPAGLNARHPDTQCTAVMMATTCGNISAMRLLLDCPRLQYCERNRHTQSLVSLAIASHQQPALVVLLDEYSMASHPGNLHMAASVGYTDVFMYLIHRLCHRDSLVNGHQVHTTSSSVMVSAAIALINTTDETDLIHRTEAGSSLQKMELLWVLLSTPLHNIAAFARLVARAAAWTHMHELPYRVLCLFQHYPPPACPDHMPMFRLLDNSACAAYSCELSEQQATVECFHPIRCLAQEEQQGLDDYCAYVNFTDESLVTLLHILGEDMPSSLVAIVSAYYVPTRLNFLRELILSENHQHPARY